MGSNLPSGPTAAGRLARTLDLRIERLKSLRKVTFICVSVNADSTPLCVK